ncbi:ferritin-like catalase Nec2 [Cannabis sativa]|uniref:ferritin-like catalase Nec2 n=1 Tax=Cannabis sativa TaxID=3483 RepID=UPI0011E0473B|nr:ferritin-like catalase Nec2 [Cannabis sativa]
MDTPIVALTLVVLLFSKSVPVFGTIDILPISYNDVNRLEFSLNLEFLAAEFFLYGSLGYGLDRVDPQLAKGGPPPIGATRANLDNLTADIITQFGYQQVGNIRAIANTVRGFPRPLLNISSAVFARAIDIAFGRDLRPPFNPYRNSINFLIASYAMPSTALASYVEANPNLSRSTFKALVAGLLGVKAGQDGVIRALLYQRRDTRVEPYNITVGEFTNRISELRNTLGRGGVKEEGLINVTTSLGVGGIRVSTGNVLSANIDSLSYGRTPAEILRIVYGTGNERRPGAFFPNGANGRIATILSA